MVGQLDRLLSVVSLPRVSLGILPERTPYRVPTSQFILFDNRLVQIEAISAEIAITQPREIALYGKAFQALSEAAVHGAKAKELIAQALSDVRGEAEPR